MQQMCAAKLRLSLHSQFLCWCPLNFKGSSKFPRPHATLPNIAPTCIYPYISWLIGSAAQLQALGEHFPSRFWGPPVPSPTRPPCPHPLGLDLFSSHSPRFFPERTTSALVPSPIHTFCSQNLEEPANSVTKNYVTFNTLYSETLQGVIAKGRDQVDPGLNSSSAISSKALDKLFNLPEPVRNGYNLITNWAS